MQNNEWFDVTTVRKVNLMFDDAETINIITLNDQEQHFIIIAPLNHSDKRKFKLLDLIRMLFGWRVTIFEKCSDLPLVLIDQAHKMIYISRELLKDSLDAFAAYVKEILMMIRKM